MGVQGWGSEERTSKEVWGAGVQVRLESFEEQTHISFAILLGLRKKNVDKQI